MLHSVIPIIASTPPATDRLYSQVTPPRPPPYPRPKQERHRLYASGTYDPYSTLMYDADAKVYAIVVEFDDDGNPVSSAPSNPSAVTPGPAAANTYPATQPPSASPAPTTPSTNTKLTAEPAKNPTQTGSGVTPTEAPARRALENGPPKDAGYLPSKRGRDGETDPFGVGIGAGAGGGTGGPRGPPI